MVKSSMSPPWNFIVYLCDNTVDNPQANHLRTTQNTMLFKSVCVMQLVNIVFYYKVYYAAYFLHVDSVLFPNKQNSCTLLRTWFHTMTYLIVLYSNDFTLSVIDFVTHLLQAAWIYSRTHCHFAIIIIEIYIRVIVFISDIKTQVDV